MDKSRTHTPRNTVLRCLGSREPQSADSSARGACEQLDDAIKKKKIRAGPILLLFKNLRSTAVRQYQSLAHRCYRHLFLVQFTLPRAIAEKKREWRMKRKQHRKSITGIDMTPTIYLQSTSSVRTEFRRSILRIDSVHSTIHFWSTWSCCCYIMSYQRLIELLPLIQGVRIDGNFITMYL